MKAICGMEREKHKLSGCSWGPLEPSINKQPSQSPTYYVSCCGDLDASLNTPTQFQ